MPVPARRSAHVRGGSDLTIHGLVAADADMATEIAAGADEARLTALGCQQMLTRLEALAARIAELNVPGSLPGYVASLMDQASLVRADALAVASNLPRAAEAIASAGANARARHMPLAQAVVDAGLSAPAERDYHVE